ncbi:MAG: M28 family peptidase [Thermonemataceae bacterium]
MIRYTLILFFIAFVGCQTNAQQANVNKESLLNDLKILAADAMEGRKVGTPGSEKAQAYLKKRFRQIGLKSYYKDFEQSFIVRGKGVEATNLVAFIAGKSNKVIVICAHYDHLGKRNGKIYNGADDNASGTAALLQFATYFSKHPPQHTIIFAALDAEESGLKGAKHFVKNLPVPVERIILNVNMDMISRNEQKELYACVTYHYPFLKPYIKKIAQQSSINLLMGHDQPSLGYSIWTNSSDHSAFHAKGIPFIYFGVEDHEAYHTAEDEFEGIMPTFYVQATRTILDFIILADKQLDAIAAQKQKASKK